MSKIAEKLQPEPLARLESLIAKALQSRLAKRPLVLAVAENDYLCDLLEEYAKLKSPNPRNAGRKCKFASDRERYAYHNAQRRQRKA